MEERISLQFFPLFSFFSLFSFLPFFFFFIFIITGYQSPSLRVYRYTREWKENWLEASSVASRGKETFSMLVNESVVKQP